jgi:hypothetical protein
MVASGSASMLHPAQATSEVHHALRTYPHDPVQYQRLRQRTTIVSSKDGATVKLNGTPLAFVKVRIAPRICTAPHSTPRDTPLTPFCALVPLALQPTDASSAI